MPTAEVTEVVNVTGKECCICFDKFNDCDTVLVLCQGFHPLCEECYNRHAIAERKIYRDLLLRMFPSTNVLIDFDRVPIDSRCPVCREVGEVTSVFSAQSFGNEQVSDDLS